MEIFKIITLSISALLLIFVGASRLINPIQNYAKNSGIHLNQDVDLLNEVRGVSTLMLLGGVLISLGTFIPTLTLSSLLIAPLIFYGFAIGRTLSISLDGKPNKQIIQGLATELLLGSLNISLLFITM